MAFEMEQNRRLVANYKATPYQGSTLLVQCSRIDEDDVNREHLQRLTPLLNGWSGNLNIQSLTQVQLDASHKTIMNHEVCLKAVGETVDSFVNSLSHRNVHVCRT
jgi:thioesterase domain-containing protein